MKTLRNILVLVAAFFTVGTLSAHERTIGVTKLPKTSQAFLKKHFPKQKVASVIAEQYQVYWEEYKVYLADGSSVEFDRKGVWKQIKVRNGIPATIVPQAIQKHVQSNYPQEIIMELKKEKRGVYDVELSNGMELKFNSAFKLIKVEYLCK